MSMPSAESVREWLQVLGIIVPAFVAAWRYLRSEAAKDRAHRWETIRAHVPDAHRLAETVAAATPTKKDDAFVAHLGTILKALGFELQAHEVEAVKALGHAEHVDFEASMGKPAAATKPVL